jgi:hypothetical protein
MTDAEKIAAWDTLAALLDREDKIVIERKWVWDAQRQATHYTGDVVVGRPYDTSCVWDVSDRSLVGALNAANSYSEVKHRG